MAIISTVLYDIVARDGASRTIGRVGDSAGMAETKVSRFGRALTTVGIAAGALAVGVGVEAVKMATTFQASMTKIQTQAGASAKDVRSLSDAVLHLASTHAEQGPNDLAQALFHLKSVGLGNVEAMKALRQSSDLAAVGGANLEDTTTALAGAWRSGIKGAQNFGQAAATVNAIIGAGNMHMQDFVSSLSSGILPAARTFGVSLKSVGAALALMTDEGIPAEVAATRLRMTLSLLGAPSSKATAALKTIGISQSQLARDMRSPAGLVGAVGDLKKHLDDSGLSAVKQAQVIADAFGGGRSSAAIMTLINNFTTLQRKQEQIGATASKFGSDVAAQRKTAEAQLGILRASTEVLLVKLGVDLLPLFTKAVRFLNTTIVPDIEKVARFLASPAVRPWTKFFAGLAAAAISAELIRRALAKAADYTGLSRVLGSAAKSSPVQAAATNMTSAADVMLTASENMLRAAGIEADAAGAGAAGAAGAGSKAAAAGEGAAAGAAARGGFGSLIGGFLNKALIATLITELGVKPALKGMRSGPGGMNWWDNPFGEAATGKQAGPLASWPGLGRFLFGGGGGPVRPAVQGGRTQQMPTVIGQQPGFLTGDISGPVSRVWTSAYQNFFRDFASPVAGWFKGLPASFVAVGHQWESLWNNGYQSFMRGIGSPVAHWITVSVPHFFTQAIPSLLGRGASAVGGLASGLISGAKRLLPAATSRIKRYVIDPFSGAVRWLIGAGGDVLSGLGRGIRGMYRSVTSWIGTAINRVRQPFGNAVRWLLSAGGDLITGFLRGIRAKIAGIASWVNSTIVQPVIGAVKHFFGIHSPSKVMFGLGSNVMTGLIHGLLAHNPLDIARKVFGSLPAALGRLVMRGFVHLEDLPGRALSALGKVGGAISRFFGNLFGGGGGVQQWSGLVSKVLGMLGLDPRVYLGPWLSQMATESGGNPRAINLWDSNAAAGDPSRGLLQVIGSTFAAYAGPFRGLGIYNPLANVFAGINYALHRYGRTGMLGVIGHGHGYWQGGPITEPIFGVGRSGRYYTFGEGGLRERVIRGDDGARMPAGPLVHVGQMVVQDATDVHLVSARLDFLLSSAQL